jgi:trans-aconitate methyltransferase
MASTHSASYPLGGTSTERDRLLSQAVQYEPAANWLLDQIGVQPGWRAVDIGCGPIGILNLLSQRVGPDRAILDTSHKITFAPNRESGAESALSVAIVLSV